MLRSFLKNAFVYALGDMLLLASGVVLLPLYTRCLTRTEFGVLEILERVSEVLVVALVLRGLPQGVLVLYRQARDPERRGQVVGAGVLLAIAAVILGMVSLALVAGPLSDGLQLASPSLLIVMALASLIDGISVVILATNQARTESTWYVAISFTQFLTKVGLCLFFIVVLDLGIWGVLAASLARALLFAILLIGRELKLGMCWPDSAVLGELLRFAWPFVPTGLCFFVLHSADRFFLLRYVDSGEIGVYGLGYRLAALVGIVSLTPLFRVWSARMHDVAETERGPQLFARMTTYLLGAYLFAGLGLCLFQSEVIRLLADRAYLASGAIVAPVVLAYGFFGASSLCDAAFYVRRQTHYKARIALASTVLMLLLYAALIPTGGLMGAALATLGGLAGHAFLTWRVARRVYPVPYEFGRLTLLLVLTLALWLAGQWLEDGLAMLPARIGLWLLWPVVIWHTGLIRQSERRRLRLLTARLLRKVGLRNRQGNLRPGLNVYP
jgi:O-antigen/teichoic acid export membrane protein